MIQYPISTILKSILVLFTLLIDFQMLVFVFWFCVSGALIHKIDIGLDQKLSMPDVSYTLCKRFKLYLM